jgi:hypothetical protein
MWGARSSWWAFVVWALEEVVGGVNWFRRLLGTGALVWIIVGLVSAS